jgi:hypothetical protein
MYYVVDGINYHPHYSTTITTCSHARQTLIFGRSQTQLEMLKEIVDISSELYGDFPRK